jgi:hypothetical protein
MKKIYEVLLKDENAENVNLIDMARVPLVTLDYMKVEFDVAVASVVSDGPIGPIEELKAVDDNNDLSLGGPRHTEYIMKHVKNSRMFTKALVNIRHWAKKRRLYGAKYGFLGGISWSLMAAFIAHFESQSANNIVRMFFKMFSRWDWKNKPVTLTPVDVLQMPRYYSVAIMTPVTPVINASQTVNQWTLKIITDEFARAAEMVEQKRSWDEIAAEVSQEEFLNRYKFCLTATFPDTTEYQVLPAKWLKLSVMMGKYPYQLRSLIWPKVVDAGTTIDDDGKEQAMSKCMMCVEPDPDADRNPGNKQILLQPVIEQWKLGLPEDLPPFSLEILKRKKKKKRKKRSKTSLSTSTVNKSPLSPTKSLSGDSVGSNGSNTSLPTGPLQGDQDPTSLTPLDHHHRSRDNVDRKRRRYE